MGPCFFILAWKNHIYGKGVVMADWAKIKAEYIADQSMSYRKLAKKYDINFNVIQKRATREKWPELRSRKIVKSESAVVDACATKEAEKAIKFYEAADKAMEIIMLKLGDPEIGTQSLKYLTSAMKDLAAIKGLQTDAERREQEARIAKLRREAEREDLDKTIELVIPDELKRFCR